MEVSMSATEDKRALQNLWPFLEGVWFWGGIGVISGYAAAVLPAWAIFLIGFAIIAFGIVRSFYLAGELKWRNWVNIGAPVLLVALVLNVALYFFPKPKEPPSADQIAERVIQKLEEPGQDINKDALNKPPEEPIQHPPSKHRVVAPKNSRPVEKPPETEREISPKGELEFGPLSYREDRATLAVVQNERTSTRSDAPFETQVVVQTNKEFPSLNLIIQCDKEIMDSKLNTNGTRAAMNVREGKVANNVFVYSYGMQSPPFGPANPIVVDLWSKEKLVCSAATF
jgi:hypothetical protein